MIEIINLFSVGYEDKRESLNTISVILKKEISLIKAFKMILIPQNCNNKLIKSKTMKLSATLLAAGIAKASEINAAAHQQPADLYAQGPPGGMYPQGTTAGMYPQGMSISAP